MLSPCGTVASTPPNPGCHHGASSVETKRAPNGYLLANGVDREEADRLRQENPGSVASRNADGTYRITRGR